MKNKEPILFRGQIYTKSSEALTMPLFKYVQSFIAMQYLWNVLPTDDGNVENDLFPSMHG